MVERIRKFYPTRCRVELVHMDDPYSKLTPGEQGTVAAVAQQRGGDIESGRGGSGEGGEARGRSGRR